MTDPTNAASESQTESRQSADPNDPLLRLLPEARRHWLKRDPVLAELATTPIAPWPQDITDPFASLCAAIIHQQVSLAASRTIHARFRDAIGGRVVPGAVLAAGEAPLRGAGLSGQKTTYILDLAGKVTDGELDLHSLSALDDEAAIAALTKVKGIGTWSAKMHLLFHMARPDVCPWEDLGVRLAVERFYGVPEPEAAKWLRDTGRPLWAPYNSMAARVLWNARRGKEE